MKSYGAASEIEVAGEPVVSQVGSSCRSLFPSVALVGVFALVFFGGNSPTYERFTAEKSLETHRPPGHGSDTHRDMSNTTVNRNYATAVIDDVVYEKYEIQLADIPIVQNFLRREGGVLPEAIEVFLNRNLTHGSVGEQATGGYVAVSLAHGNYGTGAINSTYTLVMDLEGNVAAAQVAPTFTALGKTKFIRYEGLKLKSTDTLLLAANENLDGGGFFEWNWYKDSVQNTTVEPMPINATFNGSSHDIQYYHEANAYLVINNALDKVYLYDQNGNELWKYTAIEIDQPRSIHFNHAQLTRDANGELAVFLSVRDYNAIQKVNFTTGHLIWTLGGTDGQFDLYDLDGRYYPAGSGHNPFTHQHNAEYIGLNRFAMFDNGYNGSIVRNSRMLIMEVDENAMTGNVTWQYDVGTTSNIFGDCDILPTGNAVGTFWPYRVHKMGKDIRGTYEASAVEVVPDGRVAWMMGVKGAHGGSKPYDRYNGEAPIGWAMYSIERFYTDMIVTDIRYSHDSNLLQFKVYTTYRTQFPVDTEFQMVCGPLKYTFHEQLLAYWIPTPVQQSVDSGNGEIDFCTLKMVTEFGDVTETTIPLEGGTSSPHTGSPTR